MWLLIGGVVLVPVLLVVLLGALRAGRRGDDLAERYRRERDQ